jgi:hypothetical protein
MLFNLSRPVVVTSTLELHIQEMPGGGQEEGKVRKGGFNFNHYFDIPREPNPLCFPNWACVMGNVVSCSLACGSQNYIYRLFGTSIVTPVFTGLGLMFRVQLDPQLLIWVPRVTRNEGKCRYTIRYSRQNYHKTEEILIELKVALSLTYVCQHTGSYTTIWIKMSNKVLYYWSY